MLNDDRTALALRSPEDMIRELPGMLGFWPHNSLVAVRVTDRALRCACASTFGTSPTTVPCGWWVSRTAQPPTPPTSSPTPSTSRHIATGCSPPPNCSTSPA